MREEREKEWKRSERERKREREMNKKCLRRNRNEIESDFEISIVKKTYVFNVVVYAIKNGALFDDQGL